MSSKEFSFPAQSQSLAIKNPISNFMGQQVCVEALHWGQCDQIGQFIGLCATF